MQTDSSFRKVSVWIPLLLFTVKQLLNWGWSELLAHRAVCSLKSLLTLRIRGSVGIWDTETGRNMVALC